LDYFILFCLDLCKRSTVECTPTRQQTDRGAIGLYFGVLHAIADSNGHGIENPRLLKSAQEKIKKIAKKSRRKRNPKKGVKASRRARKSARAVGKIQSKVARQRQNWHPQVAVEIVRCNSLIATEKLNLKGMTKKSKGSRKRQKSGLNRSILDVGIGNLKSLIKEKGFFVTWYGSIGGHKSTKSLSGKRLN
jgi:putative transposase